MREINLTTKISVYLLEECSEIEKKLINAAKNALSDAYAPYSKFKVGAALLLKNGVIVTGSNQENAAFPSGMCAERTAMFYANANFPDQPIQMMAVAAFHKGHFTKEVITPCGACRQSLLETENRFATPMRILMYSQGEVYVLDSVKDLLPLSFGDTMLK